MRYAIAVDVGGTHLRVGLVNASGEMLRKEKIEVGVARSLEDFFQRLTGLIREVAAAKIKEADGIGLGLPGICNQKEEVVHQLPHYPEWRDVPVRKLLKKDFSCPVVFDNDANMAAIGEHWKGVAQKWDSFIMLTLGTGIGGGIFLNGKIWHGEEGFAGEVGHMVIEKEGRPCACGGRGCWETYAASQAVPKGKTAKDLFIEANQGNPKAKQFWSEFGNYLGIGIGNLANITGVKNYVLGGGVANASGHFLDACLKKVRTHPYERLAKAIHVQRSSLQEDGNLLGAAYAVFQQVSASL